MSEHILIEWQREMHGQGSDGGMNMPTFRRLTSSVVFCHRREARKTNDSHETSHRSPRYDERPAINLGDTMVNDLSATQAGDVQRGKSGTSVDETHLFVLVGNVARRGSHGRTQSMFSR